mgnify:CR=1 FL=1
MLSIKELKQAVSYKTLYNFFLPDSFKIKGFSLDSRTLKEGEAFVALRGRRFDGHTFIDSVWEKGASLVIVEKMPEHRTAKPVMLVEDTLKAWGDIGAFLRRKYNPLVIGVTGSVGKTTIKEMIAFILKEKFHICYAPKSFNNFIGLPQTLLKLRPRHRICILELGTNHEGEIGRLSFMAHPDIAVISNIAHTHTAFLGNRRGVLKEKLSIFTSNSAMFGVLNGDDALLRKARVKNKCIFYGLGKDNHFYAEFVKRKKGSLSFRINGKYLLKLNTWGMFNIYNALAAIAVSCLLGIKIKEAVESLAEFSFPPSRFQIKKRAGLILINDAYNSNPLALRSALESLSTFLPPRRRIGIISDMLELGKNSTRLHLECRQALEDAKFSYLIFLGTYTKHLAAELIRRGFDSRKIYFATDYRQAFRILRGMVKKGDVIFIKGSHAFELEKITHHFIFSK